MAWRACDNCKYHEEGAYLGQHYCCVQFPYWCDEHSMGKMPLGSDVVEQDRGPGTETECKAWESNNESK